MYSYYSINYLNTLYFRSRKMFFIKSRSKQLVRLNWIALNVLCSKRLPAYTVLVVLVETIEAIDNN